MPGDVWKNSNWLDVIAIPFTAALMRVAWVYPFLLILTSPAVSGTSGVQIPAWLLVLLTFAGAILAHLASDTPEGYAIAALAGFSACFAVLLAVFPPSHGLANWFAGLFQEAMHWKDGLPAPVVLFVATGLLWWRGMATRYMDHGQLTLSFATGGVMMVILLIMSYALSSVVPGGTLAASMLVFLISGLATLALAGASQSLKRNSAESGVSLQLSRHWLVAVAAVIGGVVIIGWLFGLIVAPDSVLAVLSWLKPIWHFLGQVVYYVLYPIIYLLFLLLQPLLNWFQSLYNKHGTPTPVQTPEPAGTLEPSGQVAQQIPPAVDYSLRALIIVAVVALFVFLFIKALQRYRPKRKSTVNEVRERILTWDLLKQQLSSLLQGARRIVPPPLFYPLLGDAADPRRIIREAYRRLMTLAIRQGRPRGKAETPYRYAERLSQMAPGHEAAVRSLTDAYVSARYDEKPPSAELATQAVRAIQEIEGAMPGGSAPV